MVIAFLLLFSSAVICDEFTIEGAVYNSDGSIGDENSPNSRAVMSAYRVGINAQIGHQLNNDEDTDLPPIPVWGQKIHSANGIDVPAYYMYDVGSTDWAGTQPVEGQIARVVVESFSPENGHTGETYVGFVESAISSTESQNKRKIMPAITFVPVPSPEITDLGAGHITVRWNSISLNTAAGYSIYRKSEPDGTYQKISDVAHIESGIIEYEDTSGLLPGTDYRYMIKVNFPWGGGGSAPVHFETYGGSLPSGFARLAEPTPTLTPSATVSETSSLTETQTATLTMTETPENTFTNTITATPAIQFTATPTMTAVPVMSPGLAGVVERERFILISNPLRGRVLSAGIYSEKNGIVELYIYNIQGMLVTKLMLNVQEGNNRVVAELPDIASGVYVIKGAVRAAGYVRLLPIRKVAIIR